MHSATSSATKNRPGRKQPQNLAAAHMDSLGIVITFIDDNGFLRFAPVGGLFRGDLINIQVRLPTACGV